MDENEKMLFDGSMGIITNALSVLYKLASKLDKDEEMKIYARMIDNSATVIGGTVSRLTKHFE